MIAVFVVDHFNSKSDGTCITAQRYRDELVRQGHTVRVVAYGVNGENEYNLQECRIPIVSKVAKKQNIVFGKYDEKTLRRAFYGADVVHLFLPLRLGRRALKLAKSMGIPVCAAFHLHPDNITKNSGIKKLPRFVSNFIFWYWKKSFYDKVRHIHCPSQFAADEIKKHGYRAKAHVISNGVSPNFCVGKERKEFCLNSGGKFEILMVGRFTCEKRQDVLIDAVKQSKYKDIINITFAGRGPKLSKLEDLSSCLPNKPTFAFMSQEELIARIHRSDLYVHAADVEIEGMSCIEAFAAGLTPVICDAEKSAAKQFVIDGRCRFKAGDSESLREAIEYWIEHPKELLEVGAAYAEYAKGYNLENSVRAAIEMFTQEIEDNLKELNQDESIQDKALSFSK